MIHITNWSSRDLHGAGMRLSIMAAPRQWEHGDGRVEALVPDLGDLHAVKAGQIDFTEYQRRFVAGRDGARLGRGDLRARRTKPPATLVQVADGDTLLCACSRDDAAAGRCHRVWSAAMLRAAGWEIRLDGEMLP